MSATFADLTPAQRSALAMTIAMRWRDVATYMEICPSTITSTCIGGDAATLAAQANQLIDTLAMMRAPIASFVATMHAVGYPGLVPSFMSDGSISIAKPVAATTPTPEKLPATTDKLLITVRGIPRLRLEAAISVFCETLMATTGHTVDQIASAIPGGRMAPRKNLVAEYLTKLTASGMTLDELAEHVNAVRTHHPADSGILAATQQALELIGHAPAPAAAAAAARAVVESSCVVCIDSPGVIALAPCGHMCICAKCSAGTSSCPVCRSPVTSMLRVYSP